MPVSPQMRIALGHLYEKDTHAILADLGFTKIQWMNEQGESRLPYDYMATKDNECYFVEVKSSFLSGPILLRQRKLFALALLKNVLLVLWHVKDEVVDIVPLDDALKNGLVRLVNSQYLRTKRKLRRTTLTLPIDTLKFLDNCADVVKKDRDRFLALMIDAFHDKIITFAKKDYVSLLRRVRADAERLENVQVDQVRAKQ
jgi:hypothetical protein